MANNVHNIPEARLQEMELRHKAHSLKSGNEPPHNGGMEARVAKLEQIAEKTSERLRELEKDVAVIKSNYSTKADVSEAKNSIIMWVVSAILLAQLLPALLKKFGL